MKKQKALVLNKMFMVMVVIIALASSAFIAMQDDWKAPASADGVKNPLTSDAATIAAGKVIYAKECQSCHGKKGKGDGPNAKDLDKAAGDFTKAKTQAQTDGALFWKITEGRKPMPSFKKKLTDAQRWQTVVYMRTFKQ